MDFLTTLSAEQLSGLTVDGLLGVVLGGLTVFGALVRVVTAVLTIAGCWKIFNKFGEPGWKCLIPVYGTWVQYKYIWKSQMAIVVWVLSIGGGLLMSLTAQDSVRYAICGVVSVVGWIISIIGYHKLSKAFGKGVGYTIGMMIFPSIFMAILGFGKSQYLGAPSTVSNKN